MDISVVINTYNEAEKLPGALASVKDWADEIIVVDMGSEDQTLELARKAGAKIFKHKLVPYVELVRNYGVNKATGDWILALDPDERIPQTLAEKLQEIAKEGRFDAVNIPRKNIIFGKWIRHTNWWPDFHVRFFKKGKVFWSKRIHQYPKVQGKILKLSAEEKFAIEHFCYDSVSQFLTRMNRYTEIEAQNRFEAGERFSWRNFFWRPAREFLQRFIRHLGFLDGFHGFALSFLMICYRLSEEIKLWEKTRKLS